MDCGAYIGTVSERAARRAARVVAYEPNPATVDILRRRIGALQNVEIVPKAIADTDEARTFWMSRRSSMSHSLRQKRGADQTTVSCVAFSNEIERIRPDAVKLDIEYAEYLLTSDLASLAACVKAIGIEFHGVSKALRSNGAYVWSPDLSRTFDVYTIIESLSQQGFRAVDGPRYDGQFRTGMVYVARRA